ncbi:MAG: 5-methylcytosine-specific restriction endonuclease system specificity protein McrC [Eubacteriales bacterium]|nr:5-methylcytosine-specific restriction endonuclease system specificity protein McrC [Eubacteriales bacterium]
MTNDKGIFIKNIYYMLTYAFQVLKHTNYEKIASEEFDKVQDLFAAILAKGISQQLKQGLHKEYITKNENLSVLRGKLDIQGTIKNKIQHKPILDCEYDELSQNNIFNQILKTTALVLIKDTSVKAKCRAELKKTMLFFDTVDAVDPTTIRWNMLKFQRNNKNYEMLLNICFFVLDNLLQTTGKGNYRMEGFSDRHMARLFERFVLEYYKQHHTYLNEVKPAQVKWNVDGETDESMLKFLPVMQTDIMLRLKEDILIIDTKYYSHSMQNRYDNFTLHSNNLYQIFTYVKNQDTYNTGKVSGMLLYAKTQETITPDCEFRISGNRISVKTLDLNQDFKLIARQLDEIAKHQFAA